LAPHFAGRGTKEREQLGRPAAHVLVWLAGGLSFRLPPRPRLGDGLVGPRFVLAPHRQPGLFG
jgi:hypothetical protein